MPYIYMTFIRFQSVPVKRDFHIPKVCLKCVFNLQLHFGEHSLSIPSDG